jgi:hypothetical protein
MRCYGLLALVSVVVAVPAPLIQTTNADQRIPGKYIVKFRDEVPLTTRDGVLSILTAKADHVYDASVFNGFSSSLNDEELKRLQTHPDMSSHEIHPRE